MYAVTTYRSWAEHADGRVHLHGTFHRRGTAMRVAQEVDDPIVDVRDIGEAGQCPGRDVGKGHMFRTIFLATDTGGSRDVCDVCSAWADDLYQPGTMVPHEMAMGMLDELCECGHWGLEDHDMRTHPPECFRCRCGHVAALRSARAREALLRKAEGTM